MSNDNDIGDYGDYGDYDDGGHLMDHPGGPGLHVAPEVLHQLLLHEVAPVAPAHRQHSLRLLLVLGMVFSQLYSFGYMGIHQHIRELTDKSTHVFGKLCSSANVRISSHLVWLSKQIDSLHNLIPASTKSNQPWKKNTFLNT